MHVLEMPCAADSLKHLLLFWHEQEYISEDIWYLLSLYHSEGSPLISNTQTHNVHTHKHNTRTHIHTHTQTHTHECTHTHTNTQTQTHTNTHAHTHTHTQTHTHRIKRTRVHTYTHMHSYVHAQKCPTPHPPESIVCLPLHFLRVQLVEWPIHPQRKLVVELADGGPHGDIGVQGACHLRSHQWVHKSEPLEEWGQGGQVYGGPLLATHGIPGGRVTQD